MCWLRTRAFALGYSDFSLLDGLGTVEEYSARWKDHGNYLCISDHGMLGAVPRQIRACEQINDKYGKGRLNAIFACELYCNSLHREATTTEEERKAYIQRLSPEEKKQFGVNSHLLAIAYNATGYQNLVRLTSWAFLNGFYRRPRVNYEQLLKHKEGLIFTSCCYNSEVGRAFDHGGRDAACEVIERYMTMFGENFYLEIMMLDFKKQKPYDVFILWAAEYYKLPIILSNDVHYCLSEDSEYQRLMLMIQTGRTIPQIQKAMAEDSMRDFFELQDANLWMKTEEELNVMWERSYSDVIPLEIFERAKLNTVEICRKARGVELDRRNKLPVLPDADDRLKDLVKRGVLFRNIERSPIYLKRIKEEVELICRKGFASYFIIQKMMTDEARRVAPILIPWSTGFDSVGPGRGCLTGDTQIVMADGTTKLLAEVNIGDRVLVRDGSSQVVEETWKYKVKEDLLRIWCYYGDAQGVTLTNDHKVLAEKLVRPPGYESWAESTKKARRIVMEPTGALEWIRADELALGDWVFVPKLKGPETSAGTFDLAEFCDDLTYADDEFVYEDYINHLTKVRKNRKKIRRYLRLDSDWLCLIGIFTGDGWLTANGRPVVGFCFTEGDMWGLSLLRSKLNQANIPYSVRKKYKDKKVVQVEVASRCFRKLFSKWFHDYRCTSATKHVPSFVMDLPDEEVSCFLRGYHLSDGHEDFNNKFSTRSFRLANEVRFLHWRIGVPASLGKGIRVDPRSGVSGIEYTVKTPRTLGISTFSDNRKEYQFRCHPDGMLLRVRKIEAVRGVTDVYDLQVANSHNYLTTSFLVHNSGVGCLVCFLLGITDVDPIEEGLLFSRFMSEARGGKQMVMRFKNMDPLPLEEEVI